MAGNMDDGPRIVWDIPDEDGTTTGSNFAVLLSLRGVTTTDKIEGVFGVLVLVSVWLAGMWQIAKWISTWIVPSMELWLWP